MEDLLFETFPPTPPGTGDQPKKAVVLKCNWAYDDSANHVPRPIRNRIPDQMKQHGKLHFNKGTEGFLYATSPDERWGMVLFLTEHTVVHACAPLSYLVIGRDFLPLSQKKAKFLPQIDPSSLVYGTEGNLMDSFINAIWLTMRTRTLDLQAIGIGFDFFNLYLGSDLQQCIDTIIRGFVPDARRVFQDGNFSVNDILSIPELTSNWAPEGSVIYIRLYHKEDESYRTAVYVGQTGDIRQRQQDHTKSTPTSIARHYQVARKFEPEERHMIPICVWEDDIPNHILTMAEQTVILMLDSYELFKREIRPNTLKDNFSRQMRFMRLLVYDIQQRLPWPPNDGLLGLNVESPVFSRKVYRDISSIPMLRSVGSTRTFTRYRTPINWYQPQKNTSLTYEFRVKTTNTYLKDITMHITPADVESMQIPRSGFLVLEIMDDGQPHANPWIRCPAAGIYEDFIQASSLGIRFEWYSASQNTWLSTTVHKPTSGIRTAAKHNDISIALSTWHRAIYIIQALKGIVYSGHPPDGLYKRVNFGSVKVRQLQVSHLEQTYQWVHRPEISRPFPKKATFQYNFSLLVNRFSSLSTFVPSEPIANTADINRHVTGSLGLVRVRSITKCDFCLLSSTPEQTACTPDPSSTKGKICKLCSLFNRPCTFTKQGELLELWGQGTPALHPKSPLCLYPTGPLRFLAFYPTRSHGSQQVSEPRELVLGLFSKPPVSEEDLGEDLGVDTGN